MERGEDNTSSERSADDLSVTTLGGSDSEPTETSPGEQLVRGSTVGRYTVLDCIGSGGMGVVYSAFDPHLDRRVALKVMHRSPEGTSSPVGKSRLLREAQAMAKLSHPNVITVHDVGTFADRVFVAMEFIEGTTLRQWQRQEHHEWPEIVHAYVRAGRGLAAAHAAGFVHRDFKPDNVLMGFDGRVLVMDFGLARQAVGRGAPPIVEDFPSSESVGDEILLTRTGAVLGTPAYMAPEQHRGGNAVGPISDQFSFCVALYEGLYGERPFAGNSMTSLAMNVLEGTVRPVPRDTRVPNWLRRVVTRGLSLDPLDRFPSMDALLAELQRDPPSERRPWVALAVVLGLVSVGGMTYAFARTPNLSHCRETEAPIASAWTSTIQAQLHDRFVSADVPYAERTWTSTLERLNEFSDRWRASFSDRCEVVMTDPVRTQVPDPGLRCLEHDQMDFEALIEAYQALTPATVRYAVAAAEALPDPRRCSTLPIAEVSSRQVEHSKDTTRPLHRALRASTAYARTGQEQTAQVYLPSLLANTHAQRLPDLHAEALLLEASLQGSSGLSPGAAERVLRRALLGAAEAHDVELEVRVWSRWVELVGLQEGRADEGRRLALGLESALRRTEASLALKGELWSRQAALDQLQGRYDSALERARRTLRDSFPNDGTPKLGWARTQHAVGLALEGLTRYTEAVDAHAAALAMLEQQLGAQHPAIAESLLRLASGLLGAGRSEAAEASLLRARMLLDPDRTIAQPNAPMPPQDAVCLALVIDTLGLVARHHESYEDAAAHHEEALQRLEAVRPDALAYIGYPLQNLGLAYADQKRHELAWPLLERGLELWSRSLDPHHPDLAIAHLNLANTLWALHRSEAALEHYTAAQEIWEASLPQEHTLFGYTLTGIGRAHLDLEAPSLAVPVLERALQLRDNRWEDSLNIAETQLLLARALWASSEDPEAALAWVASARELVGSYEPFEPAAVRRVLEGGSVERFTDQLDPAGLSVTFRLGLELR